MEPRAQDSLRVRIVVDPENQQWILGKFARRLAENLTNCDVVADVAGEPSADADINHWIVYMQPWLAHYRDPGFYSGQWAKPTVRSTMLITHVDDAVKTRAIGETLDRLVDVGICMSRMTVRQLAEDGIPASRLTYISPAHDGDIEPRRLVVGITSRVYRDGRKREGLLADLAEEIPLDAFHFEIIGSGWKPVIDRLEEAGASVSWFEGTPDAAADYEIIKQKVRTFDYYFYPGRDEGSAGILDALAAGARTIVVPQGFHLDIPGGIDYPFDSLPDLVQVFRSIADERARQTGRVRAWTWKAHAQKHAELWRLMVAGQPLDRFSPALQTEEAYDVPRAARKGGMIRTALRDTLTRDYLTSRKFLIRGVLSRIKRLARLSRNR